MGIKALSTKLVIEQENEKEGKDVGGLFVVEESESYYAIGKVVNCDKDYLIDEWEGRVVIYPKEKSHKIGLKFSAKLVIVDVEDVHAIVEEENE